MYKPQRKIDREEVRKSLRELELLFGRKPPADPKENAPRQWGGEKTLILTHKEYDES